MPILWAAGKTDENKQKQITQMKNLSLISLIVGVLALAASITFGTICLTKKDGPKKPVAEASDSITSNIAFFQLDRVIAEYDMATDTLSALETITQNISADLQRREAKIQKDASDLQDKANKGLIISSSYNAQMQKIQKSAESFQRHAAEKQQELQQRQVVAMNQISNAIKEFIDNYNADGRFDLIIANQGGTPVISGNPGLDITQEIIDGLNEEYLKVKNGKK